MIWWKHCGRTGLICWHLIAVSKERLLGISVGLKLCKDLTGEVALDSHIFLSLESSSIQAIFLAFLLSLGWWSCSFRITTHQGDVNVRSKLCLGTSTQILSALRKRRVEVVVGFLLGTHLCETQ